MSNIKKKVVIFGSTGSIGRSALDVLRRSSARHTVLGLAVRNNLRLLSRQIPVHDPDYVAIYDEESAVGFSRPGLRVLEGAEGLLKLASMPSDVAVVGINGIEAISVLLRLLKSTRRIVLANKESLVVAGKFIMPLLKESRVELFPADSEMFALSLLFQGCPRREIERVYLTASGGALREFSPRARARATAQEVLRHPTWNMGRKITVDSATMMNKAFEIMEAAWLFDVDPAAIKVVLHKESIIHAFLSLKNAATKSCMFEPDMRIPLSYGLFYPEPGPMRIDSHPRWLNRRSLSVQPLGKGMFPCFDLVMGYALRKPEAMIAANAANDVAVENFLSGRIRFKAIYEILKKILSSFSARACRGLEEIFAIDREVRELTRQIIRTDYA